MKDCRIVSVHQYFIVKWMRPMCISAARLYALVKPLSQTSYSSTVLGIGQAILLNMKTMPYILESLMFICCYIKYLDMRLPGRIKTQAC